MKNNLLVLFAIFLINGCSSLNVKMEDSKLQINDKLKNNFIKYWSYKKDKNFEKMYKMELPYFTFINDFEKYSNYAKLSKLKEFEVEVINFKQNEKLKELFEFTVKVIDKQLSFYITDKWFLVNGEYYHYIDDKLFFKY